MGYRLPPVEDRWGGRVRGVHEGGGGRICEDM